ncbi:MAG: fibronectin type III domain-containing protein [candidate division Zixibacteria bacterium]|nr:fibronectin type III domain-containing protein [candidate division Zixibacteria bacterium]
MITIFFIIGCLLTFLFLRKKREIEKYRYKKGILYFFYKNSLDFLVPFVVVTSLYLVLALVISIVVASDSATLHFLIRVEETLAKVKSFFSIFKLNAIQALIVLFALYFLGFLRFPAEKSKKLFTLFDKYQLFVRRTYIVLVLLCSFTFFGTQLGEPTKNVSLRIKTVREGYADLCKEVQDTIAEEVAIGLYPKVHDQFPQSYQDAFELPTKIEQETNDLRDYYNSVRTEFGANDRNVEAILERGSSRTKTASDLERELKIPEDSPKRRYYLVVTDPRQINYEKIDNAKTAISKYRNRLQSRVINLLQIEGGKKITSQIPKVFTGEVKMALFRQVIKEYPILEPVVDVFFRTLDEKLETKVEQAVDRVINTTVKSPENVEKVITEETGKIVQQKDVEIPKGALENANRASKQLKNELANIEKARTSLFYSVTPKEPSIKLNSNLSVDITWSSVPEAQSYRVYWSRDISGPIDRANSVSADRTSMEDWPDEFPTYYRVTAVRGRLESKPSKLGKAELLSSQGGTRCQICGDKAAGYCTNRNIYVCSSCNYYTAKSGTYWKCP